MSPIAGLQPTNVEYRRNNKKLTVLPDTDGPAITSGYVEGNVVTVQCIMRTIRGTHSISIDDIDATDACSQVDVTMETVLIETGIVVFLIL